MTIAPTSILGSGLALLNLTVSYLTHSLVTTAAIIANYGESGDVLFVHLISIGAKLGMLDAPNDWFLSGRFPSLPGALYLQFGVMGLVSGAFVLGSIAGVGCSLFAQRTDSVVLFFFCATIESILLLSPFLFAGDLLFFPFILIGGAIAIIAGSSLRRYKV